MSKLTLDIFNAKQKAGATIDFLVEQKMITVQKQESLLKYMSIKLLVEAGKIEFYQVNEAYEVFDKLSKKPIKQGVRICNAR